LGLGKKIHAYKRLPDRQSRLLRIQLPLVSIDKIITEIDEYLVRLTTARDLLAGANHTVVHRKASTKQQQNRAMQPTVAARFRGTRIQASKLRRIDNTSESKSIDPLNAPKSFPADTTSVTRESFAPIQVEARVPIRREAFPVEKQLPKPGGSQRRTRQRASIVKPLSVQPAIARNDSSSNKIVVVSPEEVRRARERAVQTAPKRRITSMIPSSGRLAFEALFGDEADLSSGT
jgi:hypothetical protein